MLCLPPVFLPLPKMGNSHSAICEWTKKSEKSLAATAPHSNRKQPQTGKHNRNRSITTTSTIGRGHSLFFLERGDISGHQVICLSSEQRVLKKQSGKQDSRQGVKSEFLTIGTHKHCRANSLVVTSRKKLLPFSLTFSTLGLCLESSIWFGKDKDYSFLANFEAQGDTKK